MQELQDGWNILKYINENKGFIAAGAILLPALALSLRRLYLVFDAIGTQNATNWGIGLEGKLRAIPDDERVRLSPVLGHIEQYLDESGNYKYSAAFRQVREHLNL